MVLLYDYDSMFYKAVAHIVDREKIRTWFEEGLTKEWMEKEIVNLSINRLCNMQDAMFEHIEMMQGWDFTVEYFITTNHKECKRREVYPEYKQNRKQTKKGKKRVNPLRKWANMVQKEYMSYGHLQSSAYWESDDLIATRKRELDAQGIECCICSIDKDFQQLGGLFFDYFQLKEYEEDGTVALTRAGFPIKNYRGFSFITAKEADRLKWEQVLVGDSVDNIPGISGVGPSNSAKILDLSEDLEKVTIKAYSIYDEIKKDKYALLENHQVTFEDVEVDFGLKLFITTCVMAFDKYLFSFKVKPAFLNIKSFEKDIVKVFTEGENYNLIELEKYVNQYIKSKADKLVMKRDGFLNQLELAIEMDTYNNKTKEYVMNKFLIELGVDRELGVKNIDL